MRTRGRGRECREGPRVDRVVAQHHPGPVWASPTDGSASHSTRLSNLGVRAGQEAATIEAEMGDGFDPWRRDGLWEGSWDDRARVALTGLCAHRLSWIGGGGSRPSFPACLRNPWLGSARARVGGHGDGAIFKWLLIFLFSCSHALGFK